MRLVLALTFVVIASVVGHAQTKLFVLLTGANGVLCDWTDCEPSYVLEIDVDARRIVASTLVTHARELTSGPGITPDGRYLIWDGRDSYGGTRYLSVFDTVARFTPLTMPLTGYASGSTLVTHPFKTRAYVTENTQVRVLEPASQRAFAIGCSGATLRLSGNGARLLANCAGFAHVLDSETGELISILEDIGPIGTLDETGAELFTLGYGSPVTISRYDVATGALRQRAIFGTVAEGADALAFDPRTGRLYVSTSASALLVIDPATLTQEARLSTASSPRIAFSGGRRAYAVSRIQTDYRRPRTRLSIIDTERLVIEEEADLPVRSGPAGLVIAPMPLPVQNVTSVVTGRQVVLQWSAPSDPNRSAYRIEVGFMSGATNLVIDVPAHTSSYVATGVPPGTYYVRLRSLNAVTGSEPSNELRIDVR